VITSDSAASEQACHPLLFVLYPRESVAVVLLEVRRWALLGDLGSWRRNLWILDFALALNERHPSHIHSHTWKRLSRQLLTAAGREAGGATT